MKIVEINSGNHGSIGKIMLGIQKCSEQNEHMVYMFCPPGKMQSKGIKNNFFIGSVVERRISDFFNFLFGFQGCLNWFGTYFFLRRLKKIKPDLIHIHNLHSNYINIKMLFDYLKKSGVKIVWTLHDCWAFTGHCVHFQIVKCDRWKTRCYNCPNIRVYPKSFFFDKSEEEYARKKNQFCNLKNLVIVTPSSWLAGLVHQSFLKDYPVKVINNGIDLNVFKPTESEFRNRYGLVGKKMVLGVAFGWGGRKGLDVFIDLSKRLPENYRIVLVGTDDRVDATLSANIISIHRTQNQKELAEIYTAADVFANPTREEVLGLVNVESLACGTPVVTFKTGGSPECIDETCGSVVPCDDIDAMEMEILRICEETPYSKESCIAHSKKFDMNARFLEYVDLYKEHAK